MLLPYLSLTEDSMFSKQSRSKRSALLFDCYWLASFGQIRLLSQMKG